LSCESHDGLFLYTKDGIQKIALADQALPSAAAVSCACMSIAQADDVRITATYKDP